MNFGSWKEAFEAIGLIAIVASLVFVGVQLRQEQLIARAELTSQSFELQFALHQSLQDPEMARTYAKALTEAGNLSLEEMIQIDSLLGAARAMYIRECYLEARTILVECKAIVQETSRKYFGHAYGQSWWLENKPQFDDKLGSIDWIDSEIAGIESNTYLRSLENAATLE